MGGRVIQAPLSIFCTDNHECNILNGVRMTLPPVAGSQQGQLLMPSRYALQTQIAQGWPKSWAKCTPLIGIITQNTGPSRAIWANPVKIASYGPQLAWTDLLEPLCRRVTVVRVLVRVVLHLRRRGSRALPPPACAAPDSGGCALICIRGTRCGELHRGLLVRLLDFFRRCSPRHTQQAVVIFAGCALHHPCGVGTPRSAGQRRCGRGRGPRREPTTP